MDFNMQLKAAMLSHGVDFIGDVNFNICGKIQRFQLADGSRDDPRVWVMVHNDGRGATFGNWGEQESALGHWFSDDSFVDLRTKEQAQALSVMRLTKRVQQSAKDRTLSYKRCMDMMTRWTQAPADHPYLAKKQLSNEGVMWDGLELLFPMVDVLGFFKTFHRIFPNGTKKMSWALSPQGGMVALTNKITNPIRVCEGWATGKAIQEAVGGTVMCAIPCGNLPAVVTALAHEYPAMDIIICPDNDQWKAQEINPKTGKHKRNSGIYYGKKAATEFNFPIIAPDFTGLNCESKPTDWHDLRMLAGTDEVRRQLLDVD